jgi:hypothetical protein
MLYRNAFSAAVALTIESLCGKHETFLEDHQGIKVRRFTGGVYELDFWTWCKTESAALKCRRCVK